MRTGSKTSEEPGGPANLKERKAGRRSRPRWVRSGPRDPEGPTDQEAGRNQRSRMKAGRSEAEPAEPDGGAILGEKKASAGPPALRRVLDGIGPDGGRGQAPPPPLARGAG